MEGKKDSGIVVIKPQTGARINIDENNRRNTASGTLGGYVGDQMNCLGGRAKPRTGWISTGEGRRFRAGQEISKGREPSWLESQMKALSQNPS